MFGVSVYGPFGIVLSQVFYCFPHALMILLAALSMADSRLYEAADALGASKTRVFLTVTLPGAKYGLISAALVVFWWSQAWWIIGFPWLVPGTAVQVIEPAGNLRELVLGPEPLGPPQRLSLTLADQRLELASNGLRAFAPTGGLAAP